jgi:hypothetical protein
MKTWINTKFEGFYPVGTSAVVAAKTKTKEEAANLLNNELVKVGLKPTAKAADFEHFPVKEPNVRILADGNY